MVNPETEAVLDRHVPPSGRVLVADGAGLPLDLLEALTRVAARRRDVELVLGWCLDLPAGLDLAAFRRVVTVMGGYELRGFVERGEVRYLPVRLGAVPALLAGPLRPDLVLASMRRDGATFSPGTEVSWLPAAVEAGAALVVEDNPELPTGTTTWSVPEARVAAAVPVERRPVATPAPRPDALAARIGRHVAGLVPPDAAVQYGPGVVGQAVVEAIETPVRIDSGILTDAVVDLDQRGVLLGARAAYLVGTNRLWAWASLRGVLDRVERTHDLTRLARLPAFVAVNTALEIDTAGQVNVERVGGHMVGGVGGSSDFALAAARSPRGLSVVAMPSRWNGKPTLVERLAVPASTARSDVDVVVTEHGALDLRLLDDEQRRHGLRDLFEVDAAPG